MLEVAGMLKLLLNYLKDFPIHCLLPIFWIKGQAGFSSEWMERDDVLVTLLYFSFLLHSTHHLLS